MTLAIEVEGDVVPDRTDVRMNIPAETRRQFSDGLYRWTLDEYYKLGETGLFEDKRTALIQGVLHVSGMPEEPHNQLVIRVARIARRLFDENQWEVREEKGFIVPPDTDCGPDVAVVRNHSETPPQKPRTAQLIIEVATSTLGADLGIMADLYAAAGVPLYLVLAPMRRVVYAHVEPRPNAVSGTGHRYASILKFDVGQSVTLNDPAATAIPVADLLGIPSPA